MALTMGGMEKVSMEFSEGKRVIPEVLRAADTLKVIVDKLAPLLKEGQEAKGKMLICTVKQDIHDIGKNLVATLLRNNGYTIVDGGVKKTPEEIS